MFSVGQQKSCTNHAEFDHVGAETGEQSEADQPSGGQRVADSKLQQPVRYARTTVILNFFFFFFL